MRNSLLHSNEEKYKFFWSSDRERESSLLASIVSQLQIRVQIRTGQFLALVPKIANFSHKLPTSILKDIKQSLAPAAADVGHLVPNKKGESGKLNM